MPWPVSPLRRLRAPQRLVLILSAAVLLPGLLLGFFGLRSLTQERRLAEQRIGESLQRWAETTGRRLERELAAWQREFDELNPLAVRTPDSWPQQFRDASPGSLVAILGQGQRTDVVPRGQVLYRLIPVPEEDSESRRGSAIVAEAESVEVRAKDYPRAVAMYRGLLVYRFTKT